MLLMTIVAKSFSSVSTGVTHVTLQGFAGLKNVIRALNHRRAVLRLSELDERDLKDIGLVRSDVEGALATSWFNDPSAVLGARSKSVGTIAAQRREDGLRQALTSRPAVAGPTAKAIKVACGA